MAYINPRVDLAFKKIFGSPQNEDLLISLINSIVSDEDQVASVDVINPYNEREFKNDKLSVLDIKAKDKRGHFYNIEIQITDEGDYDKRALYYWAKLYAGQLEKGMKYGDLRKSIGIHILNFTSIVESNEYHSCFKLQEVKRKFVYFKDIELHTIELSKFITHNNDDIREIAKKIKTGLDLWITFLTRYDLLDTKKLPSKFNTPEIKKALDVLEYLSLNKNEIDEYDNRLKWLMIKASAIDKAQSKAREEGREEGRKEGRKSKEDKIKSARIMKKDGIAIDKIAQYTGLSEQEILKL